VQCHVRPSAAAPPHIQKELPPAFPWEAGTSRYLWVYSVQVRHIAPALTHLGNTFPDEHQRPAYE
jgi:hypothetical protein